MGDMKFIDTMIKDGLWDAFNGYHMGKTAENVAEKWQISREQQDEFAAASQNKAEAAQNAGRFQDEIVPYTVKTRKGDIVVDKDEYIRHGATVEGMAKLRPAFTKDGSVTAGNASGINDGAAGVLLMSADEAERRGIEPLARIASYATAGLDPAIMGVGPIHASRKALEKAGWKVVGPRPGRGERGLRRPGLRGEQGHGLGPGDRERQRRRHRHRPPDRRLRRAGAEHAALRDEAPRTPRRASPRSASAAAWASPCASSVPDATAGARCRPGPHRGVPMAEDTRFDQLVFSGGGTRCFWQGGFLHVLRQEIPIHPAADQRRLGRGAVVGHLHRSPGPAAA